MEVISLLKHLDWDSNFFGFSTAKIIPLKLTNDEFSSVIKDPIFANSKLVYWTTDPFDIETQNIAMENNGFLADRKITYLMDLRIDLNVRTDYSQFNIKPYKNNHLLPALTNLAIQAGHKSRFKIDPRIPEGKFEELYKVWIDYSISGQAADCVMVSWDGTHATGIVTLSEIDGRASIGLIAVDKDFRGRNIGSALVNAAHEWAISKGYYFLQVVTQHENKPACLFYESLGFTIENEQNVYHFWN